MTEAELNTDFQSVFLKNDYDRGVSESAEGDEIMTENTSLSNVNELTSDILNYTKPSKSPISEAKTLENTAENDDFSIESDVSSLPPKDHPTDNEWLDIMGSGNFKKKILKPGIGYDTRPERGDEVTVDIKYFLNQVLFEENQDLKFIVGDYDVIQGLDLVVCLMEKSEVAKVIIPAKLAYGKIGRSPDIPPESDIECDIELKEVVTIDQTSLTVLERLQLGDKKRIRGNFFYERTEYIDAIHCYERAASYLEGVRDSSGSTTEESQKVVDMQIKVYNNMAASHLKLSAYKAALKSVESVLKVQPKNVKALFRKAKILGVQGLTDEAITFLKYAASLEPETKIIQAELTKLRNQKKKEEQSQKAMYRRMFPQIETKKTSSFSKITIWKAVSVGVMAAVAGMAAYRQFHS